MRAEAMFRTVRDRVLCTNQNMDMKVREIRNLGKHTAIQFQMQETGILLVAWINMNAYFAKRRLQSLKDRRSF